MTMTKQVFARGWVTLLSWVGGEARFHLLGVVVDFLAPMNPLNPHGYLSGSSWVPTADYEHQCPARTISDYGL